MEIAARLTDTLASKQDFIALAQIGPPAIDATPRIVQACDATVDPVFRAICLNALQRILANSDHPYAAKAARVLARMFEEPRCRRVRRRIALTLAFIGRLAIDALPPLIRLKNRGARDSLRNSVQCAILCITSDCLLRGYESQQLTAISALAETRGYGAACMLREFVESAMGSDRLKADATSALQRIDRWQLLPTDH